MKISCLILFVLFNINALGQSQPLPKLKNTPTEVGVENTYLYYNTHSMAYLGDPSTNFNFLLGYIDKDGVIKDYLFDSFLFTEHFFSSIERNRKTNEITGYDGIYRQEELDFYLDNLFKISRPMYHTTENGNSFAKLGRYQYSGVSQRFIPISNNTDYTLEFKLKSNVYDSNSVLVGLEYFDSNFERVKGDESLMIYSDYINMNYSYITPLPNPAWNSYTLNIKSKSENNQEIRYVSLHFLNSRKIDDNITAVDKVSLRKTFTISNLISDTEFNLGYLSSPWEASAHDKIQGSGRNYLHKEREPVLNSLNKSRNHLISNNIQIPATKIILLLPIINVEHYDQIGWNVLYNHISQYYTKIENKFNEWKAANNLPNVEIAGVYFSDEGVYEEKAIKLIPVFNHINQLNSTRGWKLFGSPYHKMANETMECKAVSSYDLEMDSYFDVLWQQPNALLHHWDLVNNSNNYVKSNVDQEVMRKVVEFSIPRKMGFNMETVVNDEDDYNRINDYFSYGEKYGFINQTKLYYDDGGVFYSFYNSSNTEMRKNYENLYSFMKKSRNGFILNNKFEHTNEYNSSQFHLWEGNYSQIKNEFSPTYMKDLSFTTDSSNPIFYSDFLEVNNEKKYNVNLFTKSSTNQTNKALVGIEFYDTNNNIITASPSQHNLSLSTELNTWYKYVTTSTSFSHNNIQFIPPAGTVRIRFFYRLWYTNISVVWKDISIYEGADKNPQFFYKHDSNLIKIEDKTNLGNYSVQLESNQFIKTSEKLLVIAGKTYSIQLNIKEKLPTLNNSSSKALFAIECYDKNGSLIVPNSFSDLNYSGPLDVYYRYIDNIKHYWTLFKSVDFTIPSNVASIKIIVRNFNYGNSIEVDNIQLALKQDLLGNTVSQNIGIWNQITPTTIKPSEPLIHEKLIDVSNISTLSFSASMREVLNDDTFHNGLFAIEFLTENFEHITNVSPQPNTNLFWSNPYKYWYQYFELENLNCRQHTQSNAWFLNNWHSESIDVYIPNNAKWARLSIHNLSGNLNNEVKLLNIQIQTTPRNSVKKSDDSNDLSSIDNIMMYPNPASSILYVDINIGKSNTPEMIGEYFIYDILGNIILNDNFTQRIFSINHLNFLKPGQYIITFRVEGKSYSKHLIIK